MNPWIMILTGWVVMAVVMTILWIVQRRTRNAGIVDIAWSLGVGILAVFFSLLADGYAPRRFLVLALAVIWSLRLGLYILKRVTGGTEDARYTNLREKWGEKSQIYLFAFFQVQAVWGVLFAIPMFIAARNATPFLGLLDLLGILVWFMAVTGEAIADGQLARFRSDPTNRDHVCRDGLWRYSRHPNYFCEWIHWWAYVLIGWNAPYGWLTLFGPALMLFFITKVTGIPPTEERALQTRGDEYREYQRTTSSFFPWPPKE